MGGANCLAKRPASRKIPPNFPWPNWIKQRISNPLHAPPSRLLRFTEARPEKAVCWQSTSLFIPIVPHWQGSKAKLNHPPACFLPLMRMCVRSAQTMHFRIPVAAASNLIPSFSSITFFLSLNGDPRPHLLDRWHCSRLAAPRECSSGRVAWAFEPANPARNLGDHVSSVGES